MTGTFHRALAREPMATPPIWLMRQAGRYQARYQRLRETYSFEDLCRRPELSAETAMGPIEDFDFDAAILFSDLLFPLEALGLGLSYDSGRPVVEGPLTFARAAQFRPLADAAARLTFQRDALAATRARLPREKGLIGFIGGPWTLFAYAMDGAHDGALARARAAGDLYRAFADSMVPLLIENARLQFEGGADVVMVFDTAAGALGADDFSRRLAGDLATIARAFPNRLGYFAKDLTDAHFDVLRRGMPWSGFGLDARCDLPAALAASPDHFVQGNFDPHKLLLTGDALEQQLDRFLAPVRALPLDARRGWICGLGHGVLPGTPESSVRAFVARVRETFS